MSIRIAISVLALALLPFAGPTSAQAEDSADKAKAVKDEGGKYLDADGNPTYKIENGTVDWYTFSGYRRYHSDCHVCHGQDGMGSTYAPALANSLKTIDYPTFLSIVAQGRKNTANGKENVMPAFGDNKNVYCYLDDLYVYLRARADGAAPRGRPPKHEDKPQAAKDAEKSCMGG
ncbi:c-type cytochrome, methanol metabolism-related [Mesorhizobium sp. M2C.T.Ca.TU.002.02.1.1]|uniref:c-type cytochrome, methanol metabolism-related n=1 Tax=Mesorhizobium sp. M2C.T.Ca.TU.002.02.1.1 TaxID=2496788 RepID=UPI000FCBF99A|nr:c-type cytochrome, methanol metabolism-related [Mesorhizobium sp. M2C.T.Ca.TU.002.02.1.1]RUU50669.1 c-type cytochrome, methanol metabolism-related [Mesorhizobium sp. M2C.T.Ca.TU.002.02.1.1]RUU66236.1 c-type cytochrome, methanol metabolism-related [Mesorhizobium sp. M2C.T.Ca.TU.009.01.2.1]